MKSANIIFPAYPGAREQLNPYFKREVEAAQAAGFGISLVSDENTPGELTVTNQTADLYIYRGWLVKPAYYDQLCRAVPLLNVYQSYMSSYHFPLWYGRMSPQDTPDTLIVDADDVVKEGLVGVSRRVEEYFQGQPVILKDYIKSLKHEWYDACYIKDTANSKEIMRVLNNFFIGRGRDFYGGLVFRQFLDLKIAGVHPKTRTPVPIEYRTYFLHQKPMSTIPIWEHEGVAYGSQASSPPQEWLEEIGQKIISPFVGVDLAPGKDGKWWLIEVNDGGAAGLPEHMDFDGFYRALYAGA